MRIHRLKIDPLPLADLLTRKKTAEVRKFDRDYQVGDELYVYEFLRGADGGFTGTWASLKVSHIVKPSEYGLPADVGVMSVIVTGTGRLAPWDAIAIYDAGQPIKP